jgi:NADH-quinone oxidoreductase subunit J
MSVSFVILAVFTVLGGLGAVLLRNPVRCALSLTVSFAALAGLYLNLGAQFVGLVQILVYVGAVAVLIVFAILLTRSSDVAESGSVFSSSWWAGAATTVILFVTLAAAIFSSSVRETPHFSRPEASVHHIGDRLLGDYVLPLEVIGLLLTAALIGAVLIALDESKPRGRLRGNNAAVPSNSSTLDSE